MATADNLILGSAEIFTAPVGTAFVQGSTSGWTSLGHTTAAVTLTDTPSYVMASSQQAARTLDVGISSVETQITTTLREIDAARLASFVNSNYQGGAINPGGQGLVSKFALLIVGAGPAGGTIELHAPRAVYTGNRSLAFDAENFSEVEIEVTILDDSSTGGFTVYVTAGSGQQSNGDGGDGGGYTPPQSFAIGGSYVTHVGDNYTVIVGDIYGDGIFDGGDYPAGVGIDIVGWGASSGADEQDPAGSGTVSQVGFALDSSTATNTVDIYTGGYNFTQGENLYIYYNATDIATGSTLAQSANINIGTPPPA